MNCYLIESLAPLVFRSGKPFGSQASAQDVIFPLPSAGAGLIRATAIAQNNVIFDKQRCDSQDEDYQKLLSIESQGPYLARYSNESDIELLIPKPANALYLENKKNGEIELVRLSPKAFAHENEECGSDLPQGLLHIQALTELKGKPAKGVTYWCIGDVIKWQQGEKLSYQDVNDNGLNNIPIDLRTHVAIDDISLASENGQLFQTASFDLNHGQTKQGWQEKRLGFVIYSNENLDDDMVTLGGERRLSHFKKISLQNDIYPQKSDMLNATGFSLTFLTPCIFGQGALPEWIDKDSLQGIVPNTEIKVQLKAMAIDRWQAVSGWDSLLWKPKATRRAVCAGSVYWFEILSGQMTDEIVGELSQRVWSDNKQDKKDGFGSAIIAPWSF